jgi:two-component system, NtrC family, sensor histidine kinase HydH
MSQTSVEGTLAMAKVRARLHGPAQFLKAGIRAEDLVWLLLFAGLAFASPERSVYEIELLSALAIFQLAEPRLSFFSGRRGVLFALAVKLALGFLLIGFTGGIVSSYHLILLLPVVSAATSLSLPLAMLVTGLACASYLIFLHPFFLDPERYELTREGMRVLALRVIFLPVVGLLTNQLAEANRVEARRAQLAAEQLSEANRHLREAEAAVRRSERLAALGQMSAGLAHELRNPLGTVKASAEMLARQVPEDSPIAQELTGFISSEVDRANSIITRFLDFARPLRTHLRVADLGEMLDRAVTQLEHHNPPFRVVIYRNYSPDIPPFPFDPELLERVAYNLLLNAAQASPADSPITIKTRAVDGFAEFAVIDRGKGIDPANRESIFNPFFTTRQEGVGLGLAICAKIVDEHRGKILVESEPTGSVFRVLLPREPDLPAA